MVRVQARERDADNKNTGGLLTSKNKADVKSPARGSRSWEKSEAYLEVVLPDAHAMQDVDPWEANFERGREGEREVSEEGGRRRARKRV
jgi:hypothetical protein